MTSPIQPHYLFESEIVSSELLVFKRLKAAPADTQTCQSSQMQCQEKERHVDTAADTSSFFLLKKSLSCTAG